MEHATRFVALIGLIYFVVSLAWVLRGPLLGRISKESKREELYGLGAARKYDIRPLSKEQLDIILRLRDEVNSSSKNNTGTDIS
jgi:hypothetical protein